MRNPSSLKSGRSWLGLAAWAALACGSGSDGDAPPSVAPPVESDPIPAGDACTSNAPAADCANSDPDEASPSSPSESDDETSVDASEDWAVARSRVESILATHCGACHGHLLTVEDASGGINFIDELDALTENGLLMPLSSANSRILQVMRSGEMPPPGSGPPPVSEVELEFVAAYIDNPSYWTLPPPCNDQRLTSDDVYVAIADDLRRLGPDAAPSARYISFANRVNAAECVRGGQFERERRALFKLLNMVSTGAEVHVPVPIDAAETLYRVDLADYGWDQAVSVVDAGGEAAELGDKWEAIVAHDPYAVPFVGGDADVAASLSGSAVPVLLASSLLHTALGGNLYYALIGVDVRAPLDSFVREELDVDVARNVEELQQVRAVTTRSRFFPETRLLQRDELGSRPGVLWQLFGLDDDGFESAASDPFGVITGRRDVIFTLPNGSLAYLLADENGAIVDTLDIRIKGEPGISTSQVATCSYCHAGGIIPVVDELRESVLQNGAIGAPDLARLDAVFPDAAGFAQLVQADNAAFYERMLSAVQLDLTKVDPVANAFFNFEEAVGLNTAAGELGLTAPELRAVLPALAPELGVLATGALDREAFSALYRASVCALPRAGNVRPAPSVCTAP